MLHHTHTKLSKLSPSQKLHVIAVVSNPVGYKSRYKLFEQFHAHMKQHDVHLTTVELAFGEREHIMPTGDHGIQLRTWDELWHKENMINVGISRLPNDWQYVAWIDADVMFTNPHWVTQTVNQLQHHQVVQMFQTAIDMGPNGETIHTHQGFGFQYASGAPRILNQADGVYYGGIGKKNDFWHPGYAWAARREAIDGLGGLMEWPILGSADHHMALSFIGDVDKSTPPGLHPNYYKRLQIYQEAANEHVYGDIGFVPGTIMHHWHGKKKDRRYVTRWDILKKHQYDPEKHIKKDWQGVLQLNDIEAQFREDLRAYFRARNEDSIDTE